MTLLLVLRRLARLPGLFVFGTAVADREMYEKVALPGIRRAADPDSLILARVGYDSIQQPYNEMLDEAAALPGLEGVVLLHEDLELVDDTLLPRIRPLLADPRTGLVGPVGRRGMTPHRFLESEHLLGRATGPGVDIHASTGSHEVEMADGCLLAIAPWAARSLRFDERLADDFHGYDVDFSLRVRAAGGRVICNDVPTMHYITRPWADREAFIRSCVALARRWDPALRPREWAPAFRPERPALARRS